MRLVTAIGIMLLAGVAFADDSFGPLDSHLFAPDGLRSGDATVLLQPGGMVTESHKRRERGTGYDGHRTLSGPWGLRRPVFGFRLSWIKCTAAEGEAPDAAPALGIFFRFPLSPYRNVGRMEIAFDTTVYKMQHDVPAGFDDVYEEFREFTVCYLFHPMAMRRGGENFYLGFGFGVGSDRAVVEMAGGSSSDSEESSLLLAKMGWDTGQGFFFEISYRWMFSDDVNLEELIAVAVGLYF